jgi:hypothetical protein
MMQPIILYNIQTTEIVILMHVINAFWVAVLAMGRMLWDLLTLPELKSACISIDLKSRRTKRLRQLVQEFDS